MGKDKIREKDYVSQPKTRESLKMDEEVNRKDYTKKPERQSDKDSQEKKRKVMEENDYSGVRPADYEHPLTEKGGKKKE